MRLDIIFQLQEALQRTARLTGRTILHDQAMAKEGKVNAPLPDDLSEELFDNAVLTSKLRERLLDEGLRREVEHFRDRSTTMTIPMGLYNGAHARTDRATLHRSAGRMGRGCRTGDGARRRGVAHGVGVEAVNEAGQPALVAIPTRGVVS